MSTVGRSARSEWDTGTLTSMETGADGDSDVGESMGGRATPGSTSKRGGGLVGSGTTRGQGKANGERSWAVGVIEAVLSGHPALRPQSLMAGRERRRKEAKRR
jgi:hypothetical protein